MTATTDKIDKTIPPKRIERLADLVGGRVLDESWMNMTGATRENFLVYAPQIIQDRGADARMVWLILSEQAMSTHAPRFYELRKVLLSRAIKIAGSVLAPQHVIKTLYDNAAASGGGIQANEEQRSELHEYFTRMVQYALRESVSDIHIEKRSTRSIIRMRKHGQLIEWKEVANSYADRLCTVIYNVLAENKDISFRGEDEYQAAAVNTTIMGEDVKLRYQSLPVYPGGFDVVLRVLPIGSDEESITPLVNLGYAPSQVDALLKIASRPVGALIIAGTTGSGKSTTLKNLLMYVNQARHFRCKIYTIEDPPEYKIPRVSQIPVVRHANDDPNKSPFLEPLKACMRGDPDILMIGEIRDFFTGDGLKKATQSGHQVMTTVHATSALGIVERLADFSITPSVMGSPEFLTGLIYQKLVPLVCPKCSIKFSELIESSRATREHLELAERLEAVADLAVHEIRLRGDGCPHCKNMGIVGRTVCAEIIAPDFTMLRHFRDQNPLEAKYHWRSLSDRDPDSDNMTGKTVLEHALFKMRQGLVCPLDVEEILGPVDDAVKSWTQMEDERRAAGLMT